MEWHRWHEGADGASPSTCTHCKAARKSRERCDGCIEPTLWVGNEPVASLYIAMQTQWRRNEHSGRRMGLRYEAIPVTAQWRGIDLTQQMFQQIQILETAAISMDTKSS